MGSFLDPFAVFGEDEDDDDHDHGAPTSVQHHVDFLSLSMKTNTNQLLLLDHQFTVPTTTTSALKNVATRTTKKSIDNKGMEYNEVTDLPWTMPWYIAPEVKIVQSLPQFGGNRGLMAVQTIHPGTLILVEEPIHAWCNNEILHDSNPNGLATLLQIVYQHLFLNIRTTSQLHDLEFLHPTKRTVDECMKQHVDELSIPMKEQVYDMIQSLHTQCSCYSDGTNPSSVVCSRWMRQMIDIVQEEKFVNRDGSAMTCNDIYRLVLVIRYNGLESGIYLYAAMMNHSDPANCVKFMPTDSLAVTTTATTTTSQEGTDPSRYSEVRATRTIHGGEPLTISYVPRILSYTSRRHYLWEQHRFDIANTTTTTTNSPTTTLTTTDESSVSPLSVWQCMELIHQEFPTTTLSSSVHDDMDHKNAVSYRIECSISELESIYDDIQTVWTRRLPSSSHDDDSDDVRNQAHALEQTAFELCHSTIEAVQNHDYVLLLPCRKLHVNTCDLIQQYDSKLRFVDRMKLLGRLVVSAYHLRRLQGMFYGPDHYEIAGTNLDLAQGIEELLSSSPKHLLDLRLDGLSNVSAWSSLEYNIRKDYARIKDLYPRNAKDYIPVDVPPADLN